MTTEEKTKSRQNLKSQQRQLQQQLRQLQQQQRQLQQQQRQLTQQQLQQKNHSIHPHLDQTLKSSCLKPNQHSSSLKMVRQFFLLLLLAITKTFTKRDFSSNQFGNQVFKTYRHKSTFFLESHDLDLKKTKNDNFRYSRQKFSHFLFEPLRFCFRFQKMIIMKIFRQCKN